MVAWIHTLCKFSESRSFVLQYDIWAVPVEYIWGQNQSHPAAEIAS